MTDFDFYRYDLTKTTPLDEERDAPEPPRCWECDGLVPPLAYGLRVRGPWFCSAPCRETALAARRPGTVAHYQQHEACQRRINQLTDLLEEIAEIANDRADADCHGDPPRYVPNVWMRILTDIREVIPR